MRALQPPLGGEVATLLATERRLEGMLEDARREAERIVAEATAQAGLVAPAAADELARRDLEVKQELDREEAAIVASATRGLAAVDRALAEHLGDLAAFVVDRLIADVVGGSHP